MTVYGFDDAMNKVAISGGGTGRIVSVPPCARYTKSTTGDSETYMPFGVAFGLGSVTEFEDGGGCYHIPYTLVPISTPPVLSSKVYGLAYANHYKITAMTIDVSDIVGRSFSGKARGYVIGCLGGYYSSGKSISGQVDSGIFTLDVSQEFKMSLDYEGTSNIYLTSLDWFPSETS